MTGMTGSRLLTQGAAEVILLFVTMNSPDPFCASTTLLSLLAALLCSGFSTVAAVPGDEHWDNQFGPVGVNDVAQSITVQDAKVYVGGYLTAAGNTRANGIA